MTPNETLIPGLFSWPTAPMPIMRSLRQHGIDKVLAGLTTIDDVRANS